MPQRSNGDDFMTSLPLGTPNPFDFSLDIDADPTVLTPPIWPELPTFDTTAIVAAGQQLSKDLAAEKAYRKARQRAGQKRTLKEPKIQQPPAVSPSPGVRRSSLTSDTEF
jgi:hypothetical protein